MKRVLWIQVLGAIFFMPISSKKIIANNTNQNNKTYNIVDYGALNNSSKFSTTAIQKAIDTCNKNGGGIVLVPPGDYKISPIQLKTNVTLQLQEGSTLWGDSNISDYLALEQKVFNTSTNHSALIIASNASNISIIGSGKIGGQGASFSFISKLENLRPKIIDFENCKNVIVKNISLRNSAYWTQWYLGCIGVILDHITVNSFSNSNNDGFDIDSQNVKVTYCNLNSSDDGMCLKSKYALPCRNVEISNCTISSNANGIKLGTGSTSGFKNIYIHDCTVKAPPVSPFLNWSAITTITNPISDILRLALEVVDGGVMDSVKIDHINMSGIMNPLSIWLRDRSRQNPDKLGNYGVLQNVWISNITAVNVTTRMSGSITGNNYINKTLKQQVYQQVKNVNLSNISFTSPGNSTGLDTALTTLEPKEAYPEIFHLTPKIPNTNTLNNAMPAFGLFIRHVPGITINNASFNYLNNDLRPVFYLEDVQHLTANGINYQAPTGGGPLVKAKDTSYNKINFNKK